MKILRPIASLFISALLAAFALSSCTSGQAQQKGGPARPAVPVLAAKAEDKDVAVKLGAIGTVLPYTSVSVEARITGYLQEVHIKDGQDVKENERLFTIDPAPFEAGLRQAEANLAKDQAQMNNARTIAEHDRVLRDKGVVPAEAANQSHTNALALAATVAADRAAVDTAKLNLSYCYISSPVTGRAGAVLIKKGNLVTANSDKPLVVINQLQPIYVDFAVPAQYFQEIQRRQAAQPLIVEADLPHHQSEPAPGTLTFIDNAVDSATGAIHLRGTFANADLALWPGTFVDVTLALSTLPHAVVVPSEAVVTGQNGRFVFVIKDDLTVEMRPVETGPEQEGRTVVSKGLSAGEQVVTDGQLRLTPGAKVTIKENEPAPPGPP